MTPRLRVEALLVAARRVFGPGRAPALLEALAAESGLHVGNVRWALDHALELSPSEAELDALVGRAPPRTAVLVVLAANVFVAPLRALAWALAQSARVVVRTSRRAPTFTRALVEAAPLLSLELVDTTDDPAADLDSSLASLGPGSALHVYGSSATIASASLLAARRGVAAELHGPGFGAVVDHARTLVLHADAIARDVVAFDQAGCLSPRVVIALGDVAPVMEALHFELSRLGASTPRRTLDPADAAALARARDAAIFAGSALEGSEHVLLALPEPTLAPAARALVVTGAADVADAIVRLGRLGPELASVGTSLPEVARAFAHVRVAPLGRMQTPPLDGPVDRRA